MLSIFRGARVRCTGKSSLASRTALHSAVRESHRKAYFHASVLVAGRRKKIDTVAATASDSPTGFTVEETHPDPAVTDTVTDATTMTVAPKVRRKRRPKESIVVTGALVEDATFSEPTSTATADTPAEAPVSVPEPKRKYTRRKPAVEASVPQEAPQQQEQQVQEPQHKDMQKVQQPLQQQEQKVLSQEELERLRQEKKESKREHEYLQGIIDAHKRNDSKSVVELFDGIVQVGRTPKWDALWRYFVALRNISGIAQMKRAEMLWRTHPKSAELFNSTVCNVLVHLYLKDNRRDESERVLKLMAESGLRYDVRTFATLIRNAATVDQALFIYTDVMASHNVLPDTSTYSSLFYSLLKLDAAPRFFFRVLDDQKAAGIPSDPGQLTRLLEYAKRSSDAELALLIYEEAQKLLQYTPLNAPRINQLLNQLLKTLSWLRRYDEVLRVMGILESTGTKITAYHMNFLLGCFAKVVIRDKNNTDPKNITTSITLFDTMKKSDRVDSSSFAMMIRLYGALQREKDVENTIRDSRERYFDLHTSAAAIMAYCDLKKPLHAIPYVLPAIDPVLHPSTPFPAMAMLYQAYQTLSDQLHQWQKAPYYAEVDKQLRILQKQRPQLLQHAHQKNVNAGPPRVT